MVDHDCTDVQQTQPQQINKVTVLEALAEAITAISPNCSNISTQVKDADPDD